MKTRRLLFVLFLFLLLPMSLESQERVRQPKDPVGFCWTPKAMETVAGRSLALEEARLPESARLVRPPVLMAVCPHDDHVYAGPVYVHALQGVTAKDVVLLGVCHVARKFGVHDVLVFDTYPAWKGPWGPVPVSPLREKVIQALPKDMALISDPVQEAEHSTEAIVPWLQWKRRDVRILSILVPQSREDRLVEMARALAGALAKASRALGMEPAKDFALVVSNDCVHYGDQGWRGRNLAPFGADRAGYERATALDRTLCREFLAGPPSVEKARGLFEKLNDPKTLEGRIHWCGRFSVPFGEALLAGIVPLLGLSKAPEGVFLRYGTSLDPGRIQVDLPPLGVTAPANLHHWVGYAALAWPLP